MATQTAEVGGLDAEDEAQMLEAIDKWLERDVKPHVQKFDHADEYPTTSSSRCAS